MRSILEQLDGDQAILLMYLAGELPEVEREAVAQRLAGDPALRAEMERIQQAQESLRAGLSALDAAQPLNGTGAAVERKLSRLFKQWQADQARASAAAAGRSQGEHRSFWWIYPVAAVALLVIAYTVWWGFQPPDNMATTQNAPSADPWQSDDRRFTSDEFRNFQGWPGGRRVYDPADTAALADAEQELEDVKMLRTMLQ